MWDLRADSLLDDCFVGKTTGSGPGQYTGTLVCHPGWRNCRVHFGDACFHAAGISSRFVPAFVLLWEELHGGDGHPQRDSPACAVRAGACCAALRGGGTYGNGIFPDYAVIHPGHSDIKFLLPRHSGGEGVVINEL